MTVSDNKKYSLLCKLLNDIKKLKSYGQDNLEYQKWKTTCNETICSLYGAQSNEAIKVNKILSSPDVFECIGMGYLHDNTDYNLLYINALDTLEATLSAYTNCLDINEESQVKDPKDRYVEPIDSVLHICNRFKKVVKALKNRHSGEQHPIQVHKEYDVQYILNALLYLDFDDIRPEEYAPSYAGSASRIDFVLPEHHIAIEVKMTREGLADKKLGDELLADIARYKKHPKVSSLVCFIYDPDDIVKRPYSLKKDLESESNDDLSIRVVITN